jgi:F0F1-type ATP synthase assembly protein I
LKPETWSARAWREYRKVLVAQAVLAGVAALACAFVWGMPAAGWALVGGLVCVGPSALLAMRLASALGNLQGNFGTAFLAGEILKIALVAALFAFVYAYGNGVHALALLLGFIAAVHGYFLALLFA